MNCKVIDRNIQRNSGVCLCLFNTSQNISNNHKIDLSTHNARGYRPNCSVPAHILKFSVGSVVAGWLVVVCGVYAGL